VSIEGKVNAFMKDENENLAAARFEIAVNL
jgi:hypothetical protein